MFAVFAVLLLTMLGQAGQQLEGDAFIGRRVALLEEAGKGDAVVSGASVARHIELDALCLEGVNLWEPRQDIFEIAAFERNRAGHDRVPPLWIVGYVPGFTTVDKGADAARGGDRRTIAYRTLQAVGDHRLIGNDWQGAVRSLATPVLGYREWIARVRGGDGFGMLKPAGDTPVRDAAAAQVQARKWAEETRAEQQKVRFHDDTIAVRASVSLQILNSDLLKRGSRLVLVEMPVTPEVAIQNFGLTETQHSSEQQILRNLEATGVEVVRAADLPDQPLSRFRDFLHLSESGGKAFSRELGEELARRGLIQKPACAAAQAGS